ncbi:major facilitator superfamily domain-containing protein [Boeremia exigua]|uniref:major facilitator superfamily domain-containing protein n=1 Tax=Boeremia exigua TaxID=749465 RepID=UPI001E8EBADE|nr:major facilitator superfamily domain-containing protein [Boeremia exigua]KAH6639817.1 major facilitator superfamily domain-containing protein [Boeremia exigua]
MSSVNEKKDSQDYPEKDHVLTELGDIVATRQALSPEEDRRILRKIDMHLLPIMGLSYMFQFLDKSALGYTAIMGLRTDLSMSGGQYSWASGIYYFGYLAASYPAAALMVRFPVARTIAASVIVWGAILMLTATCFNAKGLLAIRFFLGAAEAAIGPGLTVIVAMWYKRSEQPLRHGAWFMGNVFAGIFGGILAYGVGHVRSIEPWKAVFLLFGALTVAWSAAIYYFLPNEPSGARFLNASDRTKAVDRVQENMTGIKNNTWKWSQSIEALLDVKIWLLVAIQLAQNVANGGLHGFGSIIIKGMGFSTLNTLLVQMLGQVFQGVFVIIGTAGSTYFTNTRTYFMAWNLAVALVGAVMIREIHPTQIWARFMGYCLCIAFSANFPMVLSMSSGNIGGFTKKNTANAMIFIAYCAGNIIGPQLFFANEAPSYPSGFLAMMVCCGAAFVLCFALRFYLVWENKKRDRETGLEGISADDAADMNFADMTDKEMRNFRYVY